MSNLTLQAAIRIVVKNCGLDAAQSRRLRSHPKANQKKLSELAGRAPEYQRYVVERLLAGETNPFKRIASSLLVYETVGFYEVVGRLHRALGSVRTDAEYLDRMIASGGKPNHLPDRLITLDLIAERSSTLNKLLAAVPTIPDRPCTDGSHNGSSDHDEEKNALNPKKGRVGLQAASALALIAKNVFNVPNLLPDHLPTNEEKQRACSLSEEAGRLAMKARDSARRMFGRADADLRVCSRKRPTRRVITHSLPDADALVSAWLAERFLFVNDSVEVLLVPRGRVLGAYRRGDCLVDVGNTHDPAHFFFDHKPPALSNRHDSCAAKLIWEHLRSRGGTVEHLQPLIFAVFAGDSAKQRLRYGYEYKWSMTDGFHAFLARTRLREATDAGVYRAARRWLDQTYQPR